MQDSPVSTVGFDGEIMAARKKITPSMACLRVSDHILLQILQLIPRSLHIIFANKKMYLLLYIEFTVGSRKDKNTSKQNFETCETDHNSFLLIYILF